MDSQRVFRRDANGSDGASPYRFPDSSPSPSFLTPYRFPLTCFPWAGVPLTLTSKGRVPSLCSDSRGRPSGPSLPVGRRSAEPCARGLPARLSPGHERLGVTSPYPQLSADSQRLRKELGRGGGENFGPDHPGATSPHSQNSARAASESSDPCATPLADGTGGPRIDQFPVRR